MGHCSKHHSDDKDTQHTSALQLTVEQQHERVSTPALVHPSPHACEWFHSSVGGGDASDYVLRGDVTAMANQLPVAMCPSHMPVMRGIMVGKSSLVNQDPSFVYCCQQQRFGS
jgi:hypothetical protein